MPRVSKLYLPNMAAGFSDPRVKVHIGDGFKFLKDYENEFDVIITDSSDPDGPAELLFQRPYFELLHGALKVSFTYFLQPIHELEGGAMANVSYCYRRMVVSSPHKVVRPPFPLVLVLLQLGERGKRRLLYPLCYLSYGAFYRYHTHAAEDLYTCSCWGTHVSLLI